MYIVIESLYTQLQLFKNSFSVFWVLHSWLTLPLPSLTTLLLYQIHRYLFIYSLPLTLSTHNFSQPGQKLSCRPRYISMLSITATAPISNHNLLLFLHAPSYHHPVVSDCLAEVWMIDRLLFHLVNFYLILNTVWKKLFPYLFLIFMHTALKKVI